MLDIKFYLNNIEIPNPPSNWAALSLQLNYDQDAPESQVSVNDWDFIRENSDLLQQRVADGITGGVGVFEGMPFKIELGKDGSKSTLFDGYLDLSTGLFQCNQTTARAFEKLNMDFINQVADGFTFEYLANVTNPIGVRERYIYIPYVISKAPSTSDAILAAATLISLIIELTNANKSLIQYIIGIEVFSWEDLFKIVIMVSYIIFLTATVVKITQDLFNAIIQPVKYHAGMRAIDLCELGADHLGFDFASETILELEEFEDLVIIPEKWNMPENDEIDFIQGFTDIQKIAQAVPGQTHQEEEGYYNGTFGQLLRDLKTMFNAKVIIEQSTTGGRPILRLERVDYSTAQELYELPPIDNNDQYRLNAEEFNANYLVEFSLDSSDKNTYTQYQGTVYQSISRPKTVDNADMILMKGLNQISIPFALAKRKNTLTVPERVLTPIINEIWGITQGFALTINGIVASAWLAGNIIISQINNIITGVNALPGGIDIPTIDPNLLGDLEQFPSINIVDFGDISGRIGMMLLENDFISVPKIAKLNVVATQSSDIQISSNILGVELDADEFLNFISGQTFSGINYQANTIHQNNISIVQAENIYKKFHYINSFVPTDEANANSTPKTDRLHNQWKIYEFENVPFCYEDYLKVRKDNKIIFVDKFGLVESIDWNIYNETANIRFRVNELYTLNLENIELIPLGR